MLDEKLKANIKEAYSTLSKNVENFRSRPSQRLMIAEISKTLTLDDTDERMRLLAVEGPTGTGKTLAYLLSAIPVAQYLEKKLIISTATIALQEQLMQKDIPMVAQKSGLVFRFEIAKGRGRYLCPSKVVQIVGGEINQGSLFQSDNRHLDLLKRLFQAHDDGRWDGDRDRWPEEIPDDVWLPLTNDRHGCINSKCRFFRDCPFFTARGKLEDADVIVANHDLLLADLFLGGGIFLPEPQDTIYVFDEAHHLANKAVEHSGNWLRVNTTVNWLEGIAAFTKQVRQRLPKATSIEQDFEKLNPISDEIVAQFNALHTWLTHYKPLQEVLSQRTPIYRFANGKIDDAFLQIVGELISLSTKLQLQFDKCKEWIGKSLELNLLNAEQAENLASELGQHINRSQNMTSLWQAMAATDDPKHPPFARWIEIILQNNRQDFMIAASPISAAEWLFEKLWTQCYGAVLTSATLTALGSFKRLRYKTGLPGENFVQYLKLESPFDFANAATLWVPAMRSDPTDAPRHTSEITDLLPTIISDKGGTLVLFASRQQMEDVANGLSDEWADRILMQSSLPKNILLDRHREKIASGEASVIFGLASFAEGIDLPGDLCTHVIIAKLPFAVPDTPIDAAEREYLEAQGKNHFVEIALADASIKLNQAVGRLLRTETDVGVVTLLDRRIVNKHYGKTLLNALPPMQRIVDKVNSPAATLS